jgi:predicted alpha-1,2-mannosidase
MVQLGPDTTSDEATGRPSRTASGYSVSDDRIRGFSATHLPGAGCPAFGDVPMLPVVGRLPDDPATSTVPFDHADESAAPGRYEVRLRNGVAVALTATDRTGLAVFRFPQGPRARLLLKASSSLAGTRTARIRFVSPREVAVTAVSGGFCGSPGRYRVNVRYLFNRPMSSHGGWGAPERGNGSVSGPGVGGWVAFSTKKQSTVKVRMAVSFVDPAGARRNLEAEKLGWSLRKNRAAARAAWARELGRLRVEGGSAAERVTFYSALYRVLLSPMLLSDADGRYPGFDGKVHAVARGRRHYTAVSGWDAYRTHVPLLAWLRPDVMSDVVRSLQRAARQGGWLPRWPLVASYTGVMNGDSAAPIIAGAHAFGARDFDLDTAVNMLLRNAESTEGPPGQGWFEARPGLADYVRLGFVPNDPQPGRPRPFGASTTLEYAADDFAVARLARAAGRPAAQQRLAERSGSWRSLLDEGRRLLLPRNADGTFPGPDYDPTSCCDGFEEGNALQYGWAVPHDMAGLLDALGRDSMVDRLSDFHGRLNAGMREAHAWLGNQPSLATPWAYLWLGEPGRAAEVVDRARRELWTPIPGGLPGNDDLGALSAWYVWASLGLYPLTPGTANLGLTVPAFSSITAQPSAGTATRIARVGGGRFVQAVKVDGAPRTQSWLSFAPRTRPREIVVATTDEDSSWGRGAGDVPPSYPAR